MTNERDWRNSLHGYFLILVPVLVDLIVEDDSITRGVLAWALLSGAVLYGREWAKRSRRKSASEQPG